MYIGTVILNMSEHKFWRSTPRKLLALLNVHFEVSPDYAQGRESKKEEPPMAYIDQINL